jgi:lysophospholipase L1-like esterase
MYISQRKIILDQNNISILALGDSYTTGESVTQNESWPFLLQDYAHQIGLNITAMRIIARTGWTSEDLVENVTNTNFSSLFDFVFILIGVNDQFQGVPVDEYENNINELIKFSIALTHDPSTVIFLSIPDYSLSPLIYGGIRSIIYQEIDTLNYRNRKLAKEYNVNYVDITKITREEGLDITMYAEDHLHFSSKMYNLWVNQILIKIEDIINENVKK